MERWFAELTTKQLRRGVHRSVAALHRAIREFLDEHNVTARPFVWTKTADEILASIARFAQRAYFGRCGSPISAEVDHLFRSKWITDFGGSGSLSAELDHPVSGIVSAHR